MQGTPIHYENLSRLNHQFEAAFKRKLDDFFRKGRYILDEEVKRFEADFATYCGTRFCIGVASGLDALTLSLMALGYPKGSEVIVPSNTFIATILAILNAGYKPVLVEPKIEDYLIDESKIEAKITSQTKAIIVVHLYGQLMDCSVLQMLASKYNIDIIEDAAQAHGATVDGRKAGSIGRVSAFSFYPTKNLGALGDGGAIVTSDESLYAKLKALRNYGSTKKYYNQYIGLNSRLDELQALFLNVKLPFLDAMNAHKIKLAGLYNELLSDNVVKPKYSTIGDHVYHIYPIRTTKRDELKTFLEQQSIYTEIHYPVPPHQQEAYKEFFIGENYPISEAIHKSVLSLPVSYAITEEEVRRVAAAVNSFF
ncbi:MAG: DegT/DnrJ/EryC1/StrS family aminotransferase [Flavobacteriales bacterium]|nr:DegT/DnrJ/EryC1/StrS family aminotransferase [Flavobacteriales bacterium]